ncbi:hypothetical protein RW1_062_00260 [Rhodococcus wratislaviensis NBRC 100605]|uniref:Transposase n=1 Tax=Rhodococcus wratislaviensis NBRC 100605 TaxID=1219028 RepID=X0QBB6_RHOWR|nr:hypothetical protein RW1_062_00260 [Rhodococcus wratislaviensis NBRC 100605]
MEQNRAPAVLPHLDELARAPPGESRGIVETIATTTTRTGLRVRAELDTTEYPTGVKIPDRDMASLADTGILTRHDFHGEWNYTLHPSLETPELN